jgi:hypothetical protein
MRPARARAGWWMDLLLLYDMSVKHLVFLMIRRRSFHITQTQHSIYLKLVYSVFDSLPSPFVQQIRELIKA